MGSGWSPSIDNVWGCPADAVVVGAGPAGSALAIMLGGAGVRTVLLDRASFPRDKPCGEGLMPAGVDVLESLGISLEGMPILRGVTYRVPGAGSACGMFTHGRTGRGVRRLALDRILAERAAATPNVFARFGCAARGLAITAGGATVATDAGDLHARYVIGADGLRSRIAHWMGWARPARSKRYALVGHSAAPAHGVDGIVVTLLAGREVYAAPSARDEMLVAVLGTKEGLRREGEHARDAYARHVREAHPELCIDGAEVRGAGPFGVRPSRVASGRVFLVGDAAGFLDPLTGDGMSDGLVAAQKLAQLLVEDEADAADAYRRWERAQWRRRAFVSRLALTLTGSPAFARRTLNGLRRRPSALDRLLEVNDGSGSLWSLGLRDWAALGGM